MEITEQAMFAIGVVSNTNYELIENIKKAISCTLAKDENLIRLANLKFLFK